MSDELTHMGWNPLIDIWKAIERAWLKLPDDLGKITARIVWWETTREVISFEELHRILSELWMKGIYQQIMDKLKERWPIQLGHWNAEVDEQIEIPPLPEAKDVEKFKNAWKENPFTFLDRAYWTWIKYGLLTRKDIRNYDRRLVKAFEQIYSRSPKSIPEDFKIKYPHAVDKDGKIDLKKLFPFSSKVLENRRKYWII